MLQLLKLIGHCKFVGNGLLCDREELHGEGLQIVSSKDCVLEFEGLNGNSGDGDVSSLLT